MRLNPYKAGCSYSWEWACQGQWDSWHEWGLTTGAGAADLGGTCWSGPISAARAPPSSRSTWQSYWGKPKASVHASWIACPVRAGRWHELPKLLPGSIAKSGIYIRVKEYRVKIQRTILIDLHLILLEDHCVTKGSCFTSFEGRPEQVEIFQLLKRPREEMSEVSYPVYFSFLKYFIHLLWP